MRKRWMAVLGLLLLPAAAPAEERMVEEIVAVVNGDAILRSDLEQAEQSMLRSLATKYSGDELKKIFDASKSGILDSMIEETLLLQEAKSRSFDVEPEVNAILERLKKENNIQSDEALAQALAAEGFTMESWRSLAKERLIKQRLIAQEVESKMDVSAEEMQNYYAAHTTEFEKKARVHLREIFVSADSGSADEAAKKAAEIEARLKTAGEDFSAVAKEVSDAPSKTQGGDLGWIDEPDLAEDLKSAIAGLAVGAVTPVLTGPKGCRILRIEEREPASVMKLEEARMAIEEHIRGQKREEEVQKYIDKLKKESYIFKPGQKG